MMLKILENFLPMILNSISPELRAEIKVGLDKLEIKAATTASPMDDMFVKLAKAVLGF